MSKQARLLKNTIILLVGVIGTRLISFVMLPFYTDWLSVEEYGTIDIFTTIISMCVPVLTLQLEQAVFRFMIADDTFEENQATVTSGLFCLVITLICIDVPVVFFLVAKNNETYLLYLCAINLQCIYVMFQQIVRGRGQNHIYTENSIILAFANVLLSILFIRYMSLGVMGYVLAFCIAHILAISFMAYKTNILSLIDRMKFKADKLKALLQYSIPMIVNNVSWWILNASDKLVLKLFVGVDANGIYAAAGKIPGLVTTVYTVFQMAWQESASREYGKDLNNFYTIVFRKLYAVLSYFVIGMLLFCRVLFEVLISDKFSEAYNHIPILLVALLFLCISQFYGGIYVGMKRPGELGWTSAFAAGTNLIIDLCLVKNIGIYAASLSTLVAYALLCMIRVVSSRKLCVITYKKNEIIVNAVLVSVAFALSFATGYLVKIIALVVITIIYAKLYQDIFFEIIDVFKRKIVKR